MKTVAIVTTQVLLGLFVAAMGAAMLAMPDAMATRLAPVGLADTLRIGVGGAQLMAGLCLLVPRAQMFGAAMLAVVTAAVAVASLLPSTQGASASAMRSAPRAETAIAGQCQRPAPAAKSDPLDWRV